MVPSDADFKTGIIIGIPIAGIIAILLAVYTDKQEDFTVYIPSDKPIEAVTKVEEIVQEKIQTQANEPAYIETVTEIPPEQKRVIRYHIVRRGETLSSIAQQYYQSSQQWKKILDANKDIIENEHRLTNGAKLIIP